MWQIDKFVGGVVKGQDFLAQIRFGHSTSFRGTGSEWQNAGVTQLDQCRGGYKLNMWGYGGGWQIDLRGEPLRDCLEHSRSDRLAVTRVDMRVVDDLRLYHARRDLLGRSSLFVGRLQAHYARGKECRQ